MADYIERERAIDALDILCDRVCEYKKEQRAVMCGACPLGSAFDTIDILPAADVKPVVHGRWKYLLEENTYQCSECLETEHNGGYYLYCPNCGADMRGNDNERE